MGVCMYFRWTIANTVVLTIFKPKANPAALLGERERKGGGGNLLVVVLNEKSSPSLLHSLLSTKGNTNIK